jgi:hypothetical protein
MGWLTGWSYRRPVTINNTNNSNTLTDYQVLVVVDTASLIQQGKMQADCDDIRFTDSDGSTLLPYWLEGPINASNTKIWVKVPSIPASGTKVIYLYYGNPTAQSESSIANTFIREIDGAQPVKLALPTDEGSGSTVYDQSGNNNNGTIYGATWTTGRFGNALSYDGIDDYTQISDGASLNFARGEGFTFMAWVKTSDAYGCVVSFRDNVNDNPVIDLSIGFNGMANTAGHFIPLMRYDDGSGIAWFSSTVRINNNNWHHVAFIYSPAESQIKAWVDGYIWIHLQTTTGTITTSGNRAIASEMRWVQTDYGTPEQRFLNGIVDEVFIYKRALSPSELNDIYNNYAYATPNYPGRVLVRKRIDPEPTTTVGNEETSEAPPIVIVRRRMLIMSI